MTDPSVPVAADDEAGLRELAHVLAHRLRGLVSGIEGYADLLTDSLVTRDQRGLALRIVEGAVRIERVLAELQLYSQPLAPTPVPLTADEVVRGALAMLEPVDAARVEVSGPVEAALSGDPRLLRQALLILLQNALESGGGGVRLEIVCEAVGGAVCEAIGAAVAFAVHNDGVIEVEGAERRVFVPFYTTKAQNLGVGLAIGRRIAEAHGGTLTLAANDPVRGVRFVLRLPADGAGGAGREMGPGGEEAAAGDATFAGLL